MFLLATPSYSTIPYPTLALQPTHLPVKKRLLAAQTTRWGSPIPLEGARVHVLVPVVQDVEKHIPPNLASDICMYVCMYVCMYACVHMLYS